MYHSGTYNLLASLLKQAANQQVSGGEAPEVETSNDEESDAAEDPDTPDPPQPAPNPPSQPPQPPQPQPPQPQPPQQPTGLSRRKRTFDINDYHPWENPYTTGPEREARARSVNEYLSTHKKDNLVATPNPFATRNFRGSYNAFYNRLLNRYKTMYDRSRQEPYTSRVSHFKKFVPYRKNNLFIKSSSYSNTSLLYKLLYL